MYKWAADNQSQGLMGNILFSYHFSFALLPVIWLKWCMKVHKYTRAGLQSPPQHILAPSQITFDAGTILRFMHAEFHFRDQWTMSLSILLSACLSIYMHSAASHVKSFAVQDTSANSFPSMPLLLPGRTGATASWMAVVGHRSPLLVRVTAVSKFVNSVQD